MKVGISDRDRHVRWNCEKSEYDSERVRYPFVVVDDRDREGTMMKIIEQLSAVSSGVERIRCVGGKVKGTKLRYLFESFDSSVASENISWHKIGKPIKRDRDLWERKGNLSIEDYVFGIYG